MFEIEIVLCFVFSDVGFVRGFVDPFDHRSPQLDQQQTHQQGNREERDRSEQERRKGEERDWRKQERRKGEERRQREESEEVNSRFLGYKC
jgi:hypothetical protein